MSIREKSSRRAKERQLADAAYEGDTPVLIKLISQGVYVNCLDQDGFTPLHRSVVKGHTGCAKLLIEAGADANHQGKSGNTPMHNSAFWGFPDSTTMLLQHGADVDPVNLNGDTPLHMAALNGRTEIAMVLLEYGATANRANRYGRTPLHDAVYYGHTQCAKVLLDAGADPHVQDSDGESAYDKAVSRNRPDTLALLHKFINTGSVKPTRRGSAAMYSGRDSVSSRRAPTLMVKVPSGRSTATSTDQSSEYQSSSEGTPRVRITTQRRSVVNLFRTPVPGGADAMPMPQQLEASSTAAAAAAASGKAARSADIDAGRIGVDGAGAVVDADDAAGGALRETPPPYPSGNVGTLGEAVSRLDAVMQNAWKQQQSVLQQLTSHAATLDSREETQQQQVIRLTAQIAELQLQLAHLHGEQLDALSMQQLSELEQRHHNGIQRVHDAKLRLMMQERLESYASTPTSTAADSSMASTAPSGPASPSAAPVGSVCLACRTRPANAIVLPCRHRCLCQVDAAKANNCPICDAVINDVVVEQSLDARSPAPEM